MHHRLGLKHDAASVWLEDVSASSFKICLRELQNFAGVHDEILVVSVLISMQSDVLHVKGNVESWSPGYWLVFKHNSHYV